MEKQIFLSKNSIIWNFRIPHYAQYSILDTHAVVFVAIGLSVGR
jgi:hypothetical protein